MLQIALPVMSFLLGAASPLAAQTDHAKSLAPFVPLPINVVERMLEAAQVKQGETVFDLGCGDGRVLITAVERFRAKAVGVELSPKLVDLARASIKQHGYDNRASVIQRNLLHADLSNAAVVTLYLLTASNSRLRPNLEKYLKPGARVVSHDFEIRGWKPVRVEEVHSYRRNHKIYVYQISRKQ